MKKLILIIIISSISIFATGNSGKSGISASIQQSQFGIVLPNWLSDNFVIAPSISLQHASNFQTDISVGVSPRFYSQIVDTTLLSYFSANLGGFLGIPDQGATSIDYLIGIGYGGEYFFSDHFSVGLELQLNAVFSDSGSNRFGNPGGRNINTASVIFVNIYFN